MLEALWGRTPELLQLRVFSLGLFVDGNVGVGVFPEGEEVLIRGFRFGGVALHGVSATELKMGKSADGRVRHNAAQDHGLR